MKKALPVLVCCMGLAFQAQASIVCDKPKLSKPSDGKLGVHFKAVVTCKLENETINLEGLKDAYLAEIKAKGSQFKINQEKEYNKDGLVGYRVDATQSYKSKKGPMRVRGEIIMADDKKENFFYELKSKSISAEGDAALNKKIINITKLKTNGNNGELTIIKEIEVEQPWYAPDTMFFEKVQPDLAESTSKSAMDNARKMAGQDVDALRK